MRIFGQSTGPYMTSSRGLANPRPDLLARTRYQIVASPHGLPMAQVELTFQRTLPTCANPEMSLAVLLDRSGSMSEAFSGGHVRNLAMTILNHVAQAGVGYDLAFYDDQVSYAGHVNTEDDVRTAIRNNGPRGSTYVTEALRGVVQKYRQKSGIYVIVVTDGEFSDKAQVQQFIIDQLLPQVTLENPYAVRLHFVGAGEGVDHEFLRQLESAAAGQGVPLVTQHHHAHLSHSHNSILDELDRAFLGVGTDAQVGDLGEGEGEKAITLVTDTATRRVWQSGVGTLGFLPRRVVLGCEYATLHAGPLEIGIQYQDPTGQMTHVNVPVPLPSTQTAAPSSVRSLLSGLHLPWHQQTPEEEAARAEATRRREETARLAVQNHQAEQQRQAQDLKSLATGGLPIQAVERLQEIGKTEAAIFTSNLSPEEAGLLRREGYQPLGLVTGSAVYHVGQAYASSQGDCEVTVLSEAYNRATFLAVSRLQQEAHLIGAHGVVGVRLSLVRHEWADKTIEVQLIGTAIGGPGLAPMQPWTCDLSGQEWWALHRAGYDPATLVWGHCTWFVLTSYSDQMQEQSFQNGEIAHWSKALGTARKLAMNHVRKQATDTRAQGVAGVRIERRLDEVHLTGSGATVYEREHHNLVVSVIGTAIRLRPDAPAGVRPTLNILSLRDGRISPVALGAQDAVIE